MSSLARILAFLLPTAAILTACHNPQSQVNIAWNGETYRSAEAYRAAFSAYDSKLVAAVPVMSDRIGGRVLMILPDADRIRPLTVKTANQPAANTQLFVEYDQASFQTVVDSVKRSKLFDSVEVSVRNDTESPPDLGYDYVLWVKVATTGPNHTGQWFSRWTLRRGSSFVEEGIGGDPGVPESERMLAFLKSVRSASAKLGGPALASGASPGNAAPYGALSGVVVSTQGDIVTSEHGVNSCGSMQVRTQSLTLPATIVARDRQNDLALLHVQHSFAAPAVFRDGAGIRQAETVVAIGYPYGEKWDSGATVTNGSVSSLSGAGDDTRFLQFTAPVQPGNSGGPLLDPGGHIVGIVKAKLNQSPAGPSSGDIPQNVNLAVKSAVVREFLDTNGVKYRAAPSTTELRSADIASAAKQSVVYVECLR